MIYELRDFFRNITKGEIIITCIALVIWTTICIFINMAISNAVSESNEVYYKSIQIDNDADLFEYAMRTNAGNTLVYGTAKCVDPVSDAKLKGQYLAIRIEIDKYEEKVRYEDIKDSEGNVTGKKAVYYEEWDHYKTISSHASTVNFLGVDFPYSKLALSNYSELSLNSDTVNSNAGDIRMNYIYSDSAFFPRVGDLRYEYHVIPLEQDITVLADLRDNNMYNVSSENSSVKIHYNKNIDETIKSVTSFKSLPNILFCITWYIAFIVLACVFVHARNKWADC